MTLLDECDLRSPRFIRGALRATYRAERRLNAPSYTRRVWLEEVRRTLGTSIRSMRDRRQLEMFTAPER